jgi:hypothetical protein
VCGILTNSKLNTLLQPDELLSDFRGVSLATMGIVLSDYAHPNHEAQ